MATATLIDRCSMSNYRLVHTSLSQCYSACVAIALALAMLCMASVAQATDAIVPAEVTHKLDLTPYLSYFLDQSGKQTIEDIIRNDQAGEFTTRHPLPAGYGHTQDAMWLRFAVDTRHFKQSLWFLTQHYEHVGSMQLFYQDIEGDIQQISVSEEMPLNERHFNLHHFLMKVPSIPDTTTTYYLRLEPRGHVLSIELTWSDTKGTIEYLQRSLFLLGIFFGGLLAMWFYNIFLYWHLRDRNYLYYTYYLGCFISMFFYVNGFAGTWIEHNWWFEDIFALSAFGALHGVFLFGQHFLELENAVGRLRWLNHYLTLGKWIVGATGLCAFLIPVGWHYRILVTLAVLFVPFLLIAGLMRWREGYEPAKIYCLGWTIFYASIVLKALRSMGVVPPNLVTNYLIHIGALWEAVFFSLALGYRIKLTDKNAVAAKNTFLGMISHELRTPLQTIISSIDLLTLQRSQRKPVDPQTYELLRSAADHLEMQMRDLTDYARLESGKLELRPSEFNASKLLHASLREFEGAAQLKGLVLHADIEERPWLVKADALRLQQIVNNLIVNAIKYTDKGDITVRLRYRLGPANALDISVKDSGIGIAAHEIPQLFKPFTQITAPQKRRADGAGMGLAIVMKLVRLFNGTIEVKSSLGEGSLFQVVLPVSVQTTREEIPPADEAEAHATLLLADDHPAVRTALQAIIEELGYPCDVAKDGNAALACARNTRYKAILLDIQMPGMDGTEVAAHIRCEPGPNRTTPVIWISATDANQHPSIARIPHAHFLRKPIHSGPLGELLNSLTAVNTPRSGIPR